MNTQPNMYTKKDNLATAVLLGTGATDLVIEHGGPFIIFDFYGPVKSANDSGTLTQSDINSIGLQMDMTLELMSSLEKFN